MTSDLRLWSNHRPDIYLNFVNSIIIGHHDQWRAALVLLRIHCICVGARARVRAGRRACFGLASDLKVTTQGVSINFWGFPSNTSCFKITIYLPAFCFLFPFCCLSVAVCACVCARACVHECGVRTGIGPKNYHAGRCEEFFSIKFWGFPPNTSGFNVTIYLPAFCFSFLFFLLSVYQDQDQDSLLVKRRNDNHSPGPVN